MRKTLESPSAYQRACGEYSRRGKLPAPNRIRFAQYTVPLEFEPSASAVSHRLTANQEHYALARGVSK